MRLLILGGTRFLGRHIAEQALAAGHQVTLLHRGQSGSGLFPQAEHRMADRNADLSVLAPGEWDAAIDTNAYVPRHVRQVAALLQGRVGQYQLVSSISVYAKFGPGTQEDAPLAQLPDPTVETITGETYGGLKALCEEAAQAAFGPRCRIVRPGLLVGPHDPTGRFTWWLQRLARGGDVLAPGHASISPPVQFIDARDAAAWMLQLGQARHEDGPRIFNLTAPSQRLTMAGLLQAACAALNPAARLTWVDEAFLLDQGVAPWTELPVWLPHAQAGLHQTDITRAIASGLHCRPLADTLRDTLAWVQQNTAPAPAGAMPRPAVGLAPEREAALLAAWQQQLGQ